MTKLFKKVKKLKAPDLDSFDPKELVFLSWNEPASNRKYVLYKTEDSFEAFWGDLSSTKIKGFCKICQKETETSLFLLKSKTSGDGTYTKKGDYICHDSLVCNRNLTDIEAFHDFIQRIKS